MRTNIVNTLGLTVSCLLLATAGTGCSPEKKPETSYLEGCQEAVGKALRAELHQPTNLGFTSPDKIAITKGRIGVEGRATLLDQDSNRELYYRCEFDSTDNRVASVTLDWSAPPSSDERAGPLLCHQSIAEKGKLRGANQFRFHSTLSQPISRWHREIRGSAKVLKQGQWRPVSYHCRVDIRSGAVTFSDYRASEIAAPEATAGRDRLSEACREAVTTRVIETAQEQGASIILTDIQTAASGRPKRKLQRVEGSFRILGEAAELSHKFSCDVIPGSGQVKSLSVDYP